MAVEFALRPRIRLREGFAPPRRSRFRLPKFVLPVAAYWLAAAGITYAFVHSHDPAATIAAQAAVDEAPFATEPTKRLERAWWQPTPAPTATVESVAAPATESDPAPAPKPPTETETETETEAAPVPVPIPPTESTTTPEVARAPAELPRQVERMPRASSLPSPAPAPEPPAQGAHGSGSLPSCEAAVAASSQDVDFSQGNGTADLPTQVIAAVLENGAWLSSCNVPANTSLDVCVAIKSGNVVGATVVARPADSTVSTCVRRRASALQFPYSSHLDIARTRF